METAVEHTSTIRKRLSGMKTKLRHSNHGAPTIREVPQSSDSFLLDDSSSLENSRPTSTSNGDPSPPRPSSSPAKSTSPRPASSPARHPAQSIRTTSFLDAGHDLTPVQIKTMGTPHKALETPSPSPNGDHTPWIGGTGLGSTGLGKSGRVIERLMAENDRLRREMKAELAKREELQQNIQTQKPRLDYLQSENARLANIKAMDDNIIQRRDRKIEELKNDLDVERQKRLACESRAQNAERRREESEAAGRIDVQTANEQARHATTHAEILQTSHQQLAKEYRQRVASTTQAVKDLSDEREEDRRRIAKLDVVTDQMRQESETLRRQLAEMSSIWTRYRREKDEQFNEYETSAAAMRQSATANDDRNHLLQAEMQQLIGRMKWLINLDKMRNAAAGHTPIPSPSPSPSPSSSPRIGSGDGQAL